MFDYFRFFVCIQTGRFSTKSTVQDECAIPIITPNRVEINDTMQAFGANGFWQSRNIERYVANSLH